MMFWDKLSGILLLAFMAVFIPSTAMAGVKQDFNSTEHEHENCSDIANKNKARLLEADVVAIDHPIVFNRLGAQNVNWMMYALRHDVVDISNPDLEKHRTLDYTKEGDALFEKVKTKHTSRDIALRPDLRPRPLVLRVAAGDYLKVRFTNLLHHKPKHYGDAPSNFANPYHYPDPLKHIDHPQEHDPKNLLGLSESKLQKIYTSDDQVASRVVGFHPQGLELVTSIDEDSSYVGKNELINKEKFLELNRSLYSKYEDRKFESASLAQPGETLEYCFYAPVEGAYLVSSDGAVFGGEGTAGNSGVGLFGAVTVQPSSEQYKNGNDDSKKLITRFYRAQVTEEELRLATRKDIKTTPTGHPIIDYEATYPNDCNTDGVWCKEGKAGKPILNIIQNNRIIHGDINALIIGPNDDGSFVKDTYPIERKSKDDVERNPTLPTRLEPFREFVSIFHDENAATQAFPYFFEHPELKHTLHGVRDSFMINYGSGGIGAEIVANRLQIGPMHDCLDCAYEEFFLSSFAVGDAAMLVDKPANLMTSQCQPEYVQMVEDEEDFYGIRKILDPKYSKEREKFCTQEPGDRATEAYYPHDPANVHHSYIGDFVKFRNLHSGKEQHIFHLHNHQWLFNPNDDNSNYIDAQGIGPGSGYTYEIAFGGSGNRNKTVGDAIFHCHYYPHFAQGMWYMWRNHDVFESGTKLEVSEVNRLKTEKNKTETKTKNGFHENVFELYHGKPAKVSRALPDGEIVAGAPIPAIVPLPGKGMAPMPLDVTVKPRIGDDGEIHGSMAEVKIPKETTASSNPGYPFWVAGVSSIAGTNDNQAVSIGSRPTTPPLDMSKVLDKQKKVLVEGHDGGLPRHALAGFSAKGEAHSKIDRFTAEKGVEVAKPIIFPEEGTKLEQMAMTFHEKKRPGHLTSAIDRHGKLLEDEKEGYYFQVNGADRIPGAPFNEPCIDDEGNPLIHKQYGKFFGGKYTGDDKFIDVKDALPGGIEFGSDNPRIYKGANIQLDVVFNKLGYHYPQQRILALWEDVGLLLDKRISGKTPKAPEPLVIRMNTFDCAMYAHTNLVPAAFFSDDYQITTPTDVIGQHIHLPKWDLTSADGGANGWNYEDGTFSPMAVRERIVAINKWMEKYAKNENNEDLVPAMHPYFNGASLPQHQDSFEQCIKAWHAELELGESECQEINRKKPDGKQCKESVGFLKFEQKFGIPGKCDWLGARTTLQRWFSDPIVNRQGIHRGLGTTFTHDHLGPSTHQQLGLYATMLTEPPGSEWRHNETGEKLYDTTKRQDGGPTSWQSVITGKNGECLDIDGDSNGDCRTQGDDSHREFFMQFGDFQHAYVKGAYYGVNKDGRGWPLEECIKGLEIENHCATKAEKYKSAKPTPDSFRYAINPSVRKPAKPVFPDIIAFEPTCPGGKKSEILPGAIYNKVTDFNNLELYSKKGQPLRPCPEAISADDVGMMVVNYRNEPLGARVYDPEARGPDGRQGAQSHGKKGDLVYAMQTRTDRAIAALNTARGHTPYQQLTQSVYAGDPFTPILRAHSGDQIKIKIQGGSHEHEHNASINGLSWLQGGSGYGQAPHSGRRNSQNTGLSEQFTFQASLIDYETPLGINDRMYTVDTSQDGLWNGVWGVVRSHTRLQENLVALPENPKPSLIAVTLNEKDNPNERMDNVCPSDAPVEHYAISAVLANEVLTQKVGLKIPKWKSQAYRLGEWGLLDPSSRSFLDSNGGSLIYNPRTTVLTMQIVDPSGKVIENREFGRGPLHDPTAILFVRDEDLDENGFLKKDAPLEPVVLRASAGSCIHVTLKNKLPKDPDRMPDLHGYTSVSGIIPRNCPELGLSAELADKQGDCYRVKYHGTRDMPSTSFNNNMIRPSNHIGLHPQMAHYDVQASDGSNIGLNTVSTAAPGETRRYTWYAGTIEPPKKVCGDVLPSGYDYIQYFGLPFQGVTLSSADFFDSTNRDRFIESINTLLDYKIQSHFRNVSLDSGLLKDFEEVRKFYSVWRDEEGLRWLRSSLGDRNLISNFLGNLIEFSDKAYETLWAKGARIYNDNPFNESCKGRMSQIFNGDEAVLFDRGKMAYAMKEIAECRGITPENPITFQVSKNTTRLFPIEKYIANGKDSEGAECKAHFVSIESGGSNLTPPDRIKQGQKGAIGALVVGPEFKPNNKDSDQNEKRSGKTNQTWQETDFIPDRQNVGKFRKTRIMADVSYTIKDEQGKEVARRYRDLILVHQKGLNLRFANGLAVPNIASEREKAEYEDPNNPDHPLNVAPEDAHDSGHMAINYGTEPMWFRFGLPPDAPFGKEGFGGAVSAWEAFSNACCTNTNDKDGNGIGTVVSADQPVRESAVPILTAYAGQEMRIRALMPTGTGRGSVVELHGHHWMRDPYLAEFVEPEGYPRGGRFADWGTPSKCIGENALAMYLGGQESVTPMAHFDLVFPRAGGKYGVKGDYLWRDHAGFGITNGLWALIRVEDAPQEYTDLYKGDFAPESLRTNCNFVVAGNNQAATP